MGLLLRGHRVEFILGKASLQHSFMAGFIPTSPRKRLNLQYFTILQRPILIFVVLNAISSEFLSIAKFDAIKWVPLNADPALNYSIQI